MYALARYLTTTTGGTCPKWIRNGSWVLMAMKGPPAWSGIVVEGSYLMTWTVGNTSALVTMAPQACTGISTGRKSPNWMRRNASILTASYGPPTRRGPLVTTSPRQRSSCSMLCCLKNGEDESDDHRAAEMGGELCPTGCDSLFGEKNHTRWGFLCEGNKKCGRDSAPSTQK